jgi:hypothetical protein
MAAADSPYLSYTDTAAQKKVITDVISLIDPSDAPLLNALEVLMVRLESSVSQLGRVLTRPGWKTRFPVCPLPFRLRPSHPTPLPRLLPMRPYSRTVISS